MIILLLLCAHQYIRLGTTPQMDYMAERLKLSDANVRMEKANGLPSFFVEGGTQKIGDKTGYWTFSVGMSVQLFRNSHNARVKAARIDREIGQATYDMMQWRTATAQNTLMTERQKWQRKLQYFKDVALPAAREQQRGAEAAYRLGATDYIGFIQTMGDAIQTELDYWDAVARLVNNNIEMEYINIEQ